MPRRAVAKPIVDGPTQFWEIYDDADFVIEVNTPFASLKGAVLALLEKCWNDNGRCVAFRDRYCGMIVRVRGRACTDCQTGMTP